MLFVERIIHFLRSIFWSKGDRADLGTDRTTAVWTNGSPFPFVGAVVPPKFTLQDPSLV